jgi:membrane-associated protein
MLAQLIHFVLHLNEYVVGWTTQYGTTTYAILAAIIFCETGLVVTPFLPGDSLLFAAGAVAAMGRLDITLLFVFLVAAAITGDNLNYFVGRRVGQRIVDGGVPLVSRFVKRKHVERTERFFAKRGARTIVLARFVPIVRTFAPFVAGIGHMPYPTFLGFSIGGGLAWCGIFLFAGYGFGTLPWVKEHFGALVIAIILISLVPMIVEILKARREERAAQASGERAS